MSKLTNNKSLGQIVTPNWIVNEILDASNYYGDKILCRYALEPACGDGRFFCQMVERYIQSAKSCQKDDTIIANELSTYLIAVEIDKHMYSLCLENLNAISAKYLNNISINWRIYHKDTLDFYKDFPAYFDWIIGNPPYVRLHNVRLHNLDIDTRKILKEQLNFTQGTTDLYLAFFEMSLYMLSPVGILGFITPNSFLYNTSYKKFRSFLKNKKNKNTL